VRIQFSVVTLAIVLFGCTASHRQGTTVPTFSEVPSQASQDAFIASSNSFTISTNKIAEGERVIQIGDALSITFTNLPSSGSHSNLTGVRSVWLELPPMPRFDQQVKEDGTITLIYNRVFQAAGKKADDLEKEIRDYYVPTYFRDLAVTTRVSPGFVYVDGEFRNPGRYPWTNGMTVEDAIEVAGGFTEFANHTIKIIRVDGRTEQYRLRGDWASTNNPVLQAGDRIHNPRQIL
jgi:protein involved in polysaccharide export with SLBB domain